MALQIRNVRTWQTDMGVKLLVYGEAGVGKTRLCATAPKPFILSAEAGLLSLAGQDIPYAEISSVEELEEAYGYLCGEGGSEFETICIDSASEIAEVCLASEKAVNKDGRAAYLNTQEKVEALFRKFRSLPKNVVFTAKQERTQTDNGLFYGPMFPGNRLSQNVPYLFDEVFAARIGISEDGSQYRYLLTQPDGLYSAKDRSGALPDVAPMDLEKIFKRINQHGSNKS